MSRKRIQKKISDFELTLASEDKQASGRSERPDHQKNECV